MIRQLVGLAGLVLLFGGPAALAVGLGWLALAPPLLVFAFLSDGWGQGERLALWAFGWRRAKVDSQ
jgi:hypothetical protein